MRLLVLSGLALVSALALVGLGGVVHTTGSSLACPDWPLCNGDWMPAMRGGVEYEHSHRLLALAVASLVAALPFVIPRERRPLRRLGIAAVVLVVVQALLGAATVLLRLPPPVSIAHLFTATALVGVLFAIVLAAARAPMLPGGPGIGRAADRALAALLLQVGLGACLRHLGAAPVCGVDPIGCGGTHDLLHPAVLLTFAHRGVGVLVLGLVVALLVVVMRDGRAGARTVAAARLVAVVAAAQVALGLAAVFFALPIALVTLHLLGAELLFLALLSVRLRARAAGAVSAASDVGAGASSSAPRDPSEAVSAIT